MEGNSFERRLKEAEEQQEEDNTRKENEWTRKRQERVVTRSATCGPLFHRLFADDSLSKRLVIEGRDIPIDKDHFHWW